MNRPRELIPRGAIPFVPVRPAPHRQRHPGRLDQRLFGTGPMPDEPHEEPAPPSPHADFIAGLPKAEIHVHHVVSASPRTVAELAARHPGKVPADLEGLREFYTFRDFAHFVEVYLAVVDLLR